MPASGAVQVRVTVGEGEEPGVRTVLVHSRRGDDVLGLPWTCHATGELVAAAAEPDWDLEAWPPADALPMPEPELRLEYGAVHSAVHGVWRRDSEVFAEISVPDALREEARRFGLHPVLAQALLSLAGMKGVAPETAASWRVRAWGRSRCTRPAPPSCAPVSPRGRTARCRWPPPTPLEPLFSRSRPCGSNPLRVRCSGPRTWRGRTACSASSGPPWTRGRTPPTPMPHGPSWARTVCACGPR